MSTIKKLLLTLLLAIMTANMAVAYDFEVNGIYYFTTGNMAVVTYGDGEVTIADANSVIVVVMGGNSGHTRAPAADVNGDGEVNIDDVNSVIDLIIKNN